MKRSFLVTSCCSLVMFVIFVSFCLASPGIELDGIQVPATLQVDGRTLYLNGYGVRTYSILRIHVYVASLYLEHLSTDPNEIIQSPETKLLAVKFEHALSA